MKKAIDIVLIPSEEVTEKAIKLNKKLLEKNDSQIVLDSEDCVPHISLCMGVIDESKLTGLEYDLKQIVKEISRIKLEITQLYSTPLSNKKIISGFKIKKTNQVEKLHKEIMYCFNKYSAGNASVKMFYAPEEVETTTLEWVDKFEETAFENFNPHITLGIGSANNLPKETYPEFLPVSLSVYQLGNYCTCRKLLFSVNLNN